ncbi:MAG: DedA family protein [Nitrospirota bacterium]
MLTFFEGESVLIASGFLAFNNYLDAHAVVLIAAVASYIGHSTFFLIALHRREAFLKFTQKLIKVNISKLESLMARYGVASIFISQWLYGFRLMSAAVLGLSRMGKKKYFTFLLISCLIWAAICTYVGYFFGASLKTLLGDLKKYEVHVAIAVLVGGFIIWFIRDVRKRRNAEGTRS